VEPETSNECGEITSLEKIGI